MGRTHANNFFAVILAAIIFIGAGGYVLYREWDMGKRCTAETVGTVERVVRERERKKTKSYAYISYEVAGKAYSFKASASSSTLSLGFISISKSTCKAGDKLALLYDPDHPEDVMVKGRHDYLLGGVSVAAGLLVLILGIRKKIRT